jgi:hypothetical protein
MILIPVSKQRPFLSFYTHYNGRYNGKRPGFLCMDVSYLPTKTNKKAPALMPGPYFASFLKDYPFLSTGNPFLLSETT